MIHLYLRIAPEPDRYLPGDRFIIPLLRRIFRKKRISSIEKVFVNLTKGFDRLAVAYDVNLPFGKIKPGEPVVVLGAGRYALEGYAADNPVIAGIALMTHPAEWPGLCLEYPVAKYLQHSDWTRNIYLPYYGSQVCAVWPAGIETDKWQPDRSVAKDIDFLIYVKVMWPEEENAQQLTASVSEALEEKGFGCALIVYGQYTEDQYFELLKRSQAMVFLCEHESQGFACCEALAMDVPVIAWDQGLWLDPNRSKWNEQSPVRATSVPYFDARCGTTFCHAGEFKEVIDQFWTNAVSGAYQPRAFVLENLTLELSARKMLEIIKAVYP